MKKFNWPLAGALFFSFSIWFGVLALAQSPVQNPPAPIVAPSRSGTTYIMAADVTLNNSSLYFDGPTATQGNSGNWYVSATVAYTDTAVSNAPFYCKLWDGISAPVVQSGATTLGTANYNIMTLTGDFSNPQGNIRMSCRDVNGTTGLLLHSADGLNLASSITVNPR